ncbi:hypothetical protein [Allobaculum sp. Allo2]|uniref:hypothetical protein n=1 Tax=Allobaculum sp. Allo2 TaxID=2853432 RepID=UPI001F60BF34|nr:hypothetical protein [Allobaculum sp. Allo2]UNT93930.1 hypothetical protein KWG61_04360 [Allobaculum sp. Allo2]
MELRSKTQFKSTHRPDAPSAPQYVSRSPSPAFSAGYHSSELLALIEEYGTRSCSSSRQIDPKTCSSFRWALWLLG